MSKGDNLRAEIDKVFKYILVYRAMDKVQKPSNSECYTPSSEPFGTYQRTKHMNE
jgi:hypothetical protein